MTTIPDLTTIFSLTPQEREQFFAEVNKNRIEATQKRIDELLQCPQSEIEEELISWYNFQPFGRKGIGEKNEDIAFLQKIYKQRFGKNFVFKASIPECLRQECLEFYEQNKETYSHEIDFVDAFLEIDANREKVGHLTVELRISLEDLFEGLMQEG